MTRPPGPNPAESQAQPDIQLDDEGLVRLHGGTVEARSEGPGGHNVGEEGAHTAVEMAILLASVRTG